MSEIDWDSIFEQVLDKLEGADDAVIERFVATVQQPLTESELTWLKEGQNQREPERWKIPDEPLPPSYLSLLRWSNGGEFQNGDRLIQFFPALNEKDGVRAMMLAYAVPYYDPGILPFAFNGGGIFYAFDMRLKPPSDGEFSIVAAECGGLSGIFPLAKNLLAACRERRSIEVLWDEAQEITRPMCDECGEYLVCPECGKRGPTSR